MDKTRFLKYFGFDQIFLMNHNESTSRQCRAQFNNTDCLNEFKSNYLRKKLPQVSNKSVNSLKLGEYLI